MYFSQEKSMISLLRWAQYIASSHLSCGLPPNPAYLEQTIKSQRKKRRKFWFWFWHMILLPTVTAHVNSCGKELFTVWSATTGWREQHLLFAFLASLVAVHSFSHAGLFWTSVTLRLARLFSTTLIQYQCSWKQLTTSQVPRPTCYCHKWVGEPDYSQYTTHTIQCNLHNLHKSFYNVSLK